MADTIFGWDASHHDWGRGSMDIAAAVRAGIQFMTHKIGEADNFTDTRYDDFYRRARAADVGLVGAYYVNHPGDQYTQADRFLALLDQHADGWRDGPFLLQVDAEKFDYMDRAPNATEIRAFCDRLVDKTDGRYRPIVYAPKWLYGDQLKGLPYPLWASNYATNPTGAYRGLYPGDTSSRWVAYSGQTPAILQYGSRTTIGTQKTCDANAFRGTLAELIALTGDAMTDLSYEPRDKPKSIGDRAAATLLADQWGQEMNGKSPVDGDQSFRTKQLGRIETKLDQLLARPVVDVDEAALARELAPLVDAGATVEELAAAAAGKMRALLAERDSRIAEALAPADQG